MLDLYATDDLAKEANKSALLLAYARYQEQVAPFATSKERVAYAEPEIKRIIKECATELNADQVYIENHLRKIIADALPQTKPERIKLEFPTNNEFAKEHGYGGGPAAPPLKHDPAKVNPHPD